MMTIRWSLNEAVGIVWDLRVYRYITKEGRVCPKDNGKGFVVCLSISWYVENQLNLLQRDTGGC